MYVIGTRAGAPPLLMQLLALDPKFKGYIFSGLPKDTSPNDVKWATKLSEDNGVALNYSDGRRGNCLRLRAYLHNTFGSVKAVLWYRQNYLRAFGTLGRWKESKAGGTGRLKVSPNEFFGYCWTMEQSLKVDRMEFPDHLEYTYERFMVDVPKAWAEICEFCGIKAALPPQVVVDQSEIPLTELIVNYDDLMHAVAKSMWVHKLADWFDL